MAGANYMGGRRSAARARIKDAAGKAQRAHFGKKRFEVLRTGLSKSGAPRSSSTRDIGRTPPEISFAHAKRAHCESMNKRESGWQNMWMPLVTPRSQSCRSPSAPSIASNRSKILQALDAESSVAQRTIVDKILQVPDLLGLSRPETRRSSTISDGTSPDRPRTPTRLQTSPNKERDPPSPGMDDSFTEYASSTIAQPGTDCTFHRGRTPYNPQSVMKSDASFIPMRFDSSPPAHAEDFGYADCWSNSPSNALYDSTSRLFDLFESARVPFYPRSADISQCHSTKAITPRFTTPMFRPRSPPTPETLLASPFNTISAANSPLPSPAHVDLPPLAQVQYLSDVPTRGDCISPLSPLPPSDLSGFMWTGYTSPDCNEVPQASSSLDYVDDEGYAQEFSYAHSPSSSVSSQGSVYSLMGDELGLATANVTSQFAEDVHWETVCLSDALGELFEGADPWTVLSELLELPAVDKASYLEDMLYALPSRSGVGFTEAAPCPTFEDGPTSDTLLGNIEDDLFPVSASLPDSLAVHPPDKPQTPTASVTTVFDKTPFLADGIVHSSPLGLPSLSIIQPEDLGSSSSQLLAAMVSMADACLNRGDEAVLRAPSEAREQGVPAHESRGDRGSGDPVATLSRSEDVFVDGPTLFANEELLDVESEGE